MSARARASSRFLFATGGFAALAGAVLAVWPALVASSAREVATALALLATRELGLALATIGGLLIVIARSGSPRLQRSAVALIGGLAALLAVNHGVRLLTEAEPLFEPAHSLGEIAALALLAGASVIVGVRAGRDLNGE